MSWRTVSSLASLILLASSSFSCSNSSSPSSTQTPTGDGGSTVDDDAGNGEPPLITILPEDLYSGFDGTHTFQVRASKGGLTALLHAARQGYLPAAKALLDGGAKVNEVSAGDGTSPLLMATINGQFDMAMLLLERGADPNIAAGVNGATPLWSVVNTQWQPRTRFPQPQEMEQQKATYLDVMKALLENLREYGASEYLDYDSTRQLVWMYERILSDLEPSLESADSTPAIPAGWLDQADRFALGVGSGASNGNSQRCVTSAANGSTATR